MEVIGIVCLLALYKYLDSPSKMDAIVIEDYEDNAIKSIH